MPLVVRAADQAPLIRKAHNEIDCCGGKNNFRVVRDSWQDLSPCILVHGNESPSAKEDRCNELTSDSDTEHDVSVMSDDSEDSDSITPCQRHEEPLHDSIIHSPQDEGQVDIAFDEGKLPRVDSVRKSVQFIHHDTEVTSKDISSATSTAVSDEVAAPPDKAPPSASSFLLFRINYVLVTVAIMLADGLQGTHLYVLYEGYGYSVASLYCLGFVTGAVTSPITGALVDKIGRKKAALLYCGLEIFINMLEQYPALAGLIISRMIGGITTNLLSSVFETWLDTEYRRRGFEKEKYEIVMRDSVVASNLAAIASGYLAHKLAERFGAVGPFEGAVACTAVAFAIVLAVWTENYGSVQPGLKSVSNYLTEAIETFKSDSKVLRVGIIQGFTMGSLQIFVFLWSPALRELSRSSADGVLGLDKNGEPAYGLIFGAFMAAGVIGGVIAPFIRKATTLLLSPLAKSCSETVTIEGEGEVRPMAVEFLAAFCYLFSAGLLLTPCLVSTDGMFSFSTLLVAFLMYEFMIGIYMPCEGVIRSLYIPSDARCSMMTFPRIIVNVAVSIGVISTRFVTLNTAFFAVSCLMAVSAILQLSLVSAREWASLFGRVDRWKRKAVRSLSFSPGLDDDDAEEDKRRRYRRVQSMPADVLRTHAEELEALSKKNE